MADHVTWTEWVRVVAMTSAFVASVWFISVYSRHTWESTPYGRNVMSVTLGIGVTGAFGVLHTLSGSGVANLLESAAWFFVGVSLCKRRYLLSQANRDRHHALGVDSIGGAAPEEGA